MADLMKEVDKRIGLQRAGDSTRDPADISDGAPGSAPARKNAVKVASVSPGSKTVKADSKSASANTGNGAGLETGTNAVVSDTEKAVVSASEKAIEDARPPASSSASRKAGRTASKPAPKKGRRIGRPTGPPRNQLSVRILAGLDDALTRAVDDTGLNPQSIVDEALSDWLTTRGFLPTPP